MLLFAYPALRASELVGTDLVQAIPLVGAAALGHVFFGAVELVVRSIAELVACTAKVATSLGERLSRRSWNLRWWSPA